MILVAFIGTAVVLVIVNLFVRSPKGYGAAVTVSFLALIASVLACGGAIFLPPVFATALLLLVGSAACAVKQPAVQNFRLMTIGAGIIGMFAGFGFSMPYIASLHRLRQEYPVASLASRLAYEKQHNEVKPGKGTPRPARIFARPPKGSPAWDNLAMQEHEMSLRGDRREWALREIHASTVEQFMKAPGFGISRMSSVSDFWLKNRRPPLAPLPAPPEEASPPTLSGPLHIVTERRPFDRGQSWLGLNDRLSALHRDGTSDFVNPDGFGWIVDRDHVAGFESHGFSGHFPTGYGKNSADDSPTLELTRLELVSLLKFETPRVYVSNQKLPQLDELRDAPTRVLTPFETAALALVEKGEDLVFAEQEQSVLAFGSLRAIAQCLKCHEVERGALLGAFVYQFHREASGLKSTNRPARRPALQEKRPSAPAL